MSKKRTDPNLEDLKPEQSLELLKELHILTREGKLNQDSRRKLKQIYHLYHFIEPLLKESFEKNENLTLVDHGAGKSYLGFILYDLFFKAQATGQIFGIETRTNLVEKSTELAKKLNFPRMQFLNASVAESIQSKELPETVDIVTALHACDTATDDAIDFALHKKAQHIILIPCCQAEVASILRQNKSRSLAKPLSEVWRHALHTREFGSHLTNVLRCLRLEAYGYQVTVTEFTGLEHSLKNELILAKKIEHKRSRQIERLQQLLTEFGIEELRQRFDTSF